MSGDRGAGDERDGFATVGRGFSRRPQLPTDRQLPRSSFDGSRIRTLELRIRMLHPTPDSEPDGSSTTSPRSAKAW
jgi:hypothetical protein